MALVAGDTVSLAYRQFGIVCLQTIQNPMPTDVLESHEADYEQRIQEPPFYADDTECYVSDDSELYDRK